MITIYHYQNTLILHYYGAEVLQDASESGCFRAKCAHNLPKPEAACRMRLAGGFRGLTRLRWKRRHWRWFVGRDHKVLSIGRVIDSYLKDRY